MYFYKAGIFFGLLISFATPGTAACPLKITTTQQLTGDYPGWASFRNEVIHFTEGVSFYSGPPEEQAVLKPDSSAQGKARWTFSAKDTIYIVCEYNQTMIHLSRKLPPNTTTCEVRYDQSIHGANGPIPTTIICH